MKTYVTLVMTILGILVISGCSGDKLAGDIKIEWDGDRSYKAIVKDDDGTERVQLDCQYIGKGPEQPMKTPIDRDWKVSDTDFYHITMVNLTDHPIELVNVSFRLKEGKGGKIYATKTQTEIDKSWGAHVLPPRGQLNRRNAIVWGKGKANVLHKIYLAKTEGKSFKIDIPLVYKRHK